MLIGNVTPQPSPFPTAISLLPSRSRAAFWPRTLKGRERFNVKGSKSTHAETSLPVHPDKVTLDEYHDFLAIERQ